MELDEAINILNDIENDKRFRFDEDKHEYTYLNEDSSIQTFTSVTGLVSSFKKPFDSDYHSLRKAKERGVSQDVILNEWKEKGNNSALLGTYVHEWIEKFRAGVPINDIEIPVHPSEEQMYSVQFRIDKFLKLYESRLYKVKPVKQEFRIFSKKWGIAGTIDDIGYVDNVGLVIGDWKTNKSISTDADKNYDMLLPPFDDTWNNEHNLYSIQISTYRLILEEEFNIKTELGYIVSINPDNDDAKLYKAIDYRDRIRKYLDKKNMIF